MSRKKLSLLRRPGAPRAAGAGAAGGPATLMGACASKKKKKKKGAGRSQRASTEPRTPAAAAAPAPTAKPWHPASPVDRQAAAAVGRLLAAAAGRAKGAALKTLTLAPGNVAPAATHAVAARTLERAAMLGAAVDGAALLASHPRLTRPVALVLAYEVLMGQGLRPVGPAERAVLGAADDLKAALAAAAAAPGGLPSAAAPPPPRPRAVRANALVWKVDEAVAWLASDPGSTHLPAPARHACLPDVLVFPPGTDLHAHPAVLDGRLILQSASSCMPAHALAPGAGWTVLDACAAPGNKTTHVAAMVGPTGTVIGCDRDADRLAVLAATAARARAGAVIHPLHADFLGLRGGGGTDGSPAHPALPRVRAILLDPSCSGSGTAAVRGDWLTGGGGEDGGGGNARLDRLAAFQLAALTHALSPSFPAVRRVTYSTCSIHVHENEAVVAAALAAPGGRAAGWRLEVALPAWHRRGLRGAAPGLTDEESDALVRVDAVEDETDGFFVALFVNDGR